MIRNRFTLALRSLKRNGGYTLLHAVGLAAGVAACLVIGLYIRTELRYDRFHADVSRIHRVVQATPAGDAFGPGNVRMLEGSATTPPGLAHALKRNTPGVSQATVVDRLSQRLLQTGDRSLYTDRLLRADTAFFDVFSFEMLRGDGKRALDAPGRIVLTESMAARLFGSDDPVGRTVTYESEASYEVTGVIADPPVASHLQFDAIRSLTAPERAVRYGSDVLWPYFGGHLYLKVAPAAKAASVEAAVRTFERAANKPSWMPEAPRLRLQPLADVHLYSTGLRDDIAVHGDVRYLYFFGLIAGLILLIACINYVNLATAQAAQRSREVGVRKVVGARRSQLIGQFTSESVLLAMLVLPLAAVVAWASLPLVESVSGTALSLSAVPLTGGLAAALGLVAFVGVGAGIYPAVVLSRFHPATILTAAGRTTTGTGTPWLRKTLVVVQFGTAAALLLATLVVSDQLDYVQEKALGFDEEHVITFDKGPLGEQFGAFRETLEAQTAVASVSAGPPAGIDHKSMTFDVTHPETEAKQRVSMLSVAPGYTDALGLRVVRGRAFTPERTGNAGRAVLLSESAVDAYGLRGDPVGQSIAWTPGGTPEETRTVIGVVADFHNTSLHAPIDPVVLALRPERTWTALVRLAPGALSSRLDVVRQTWTRFVPNRPFTFDFLDEQIGAQYRSEQRLATLFGIFAGLAIFVASLGVFGLAALLTQQRLREMSIRKVLGASASHIVRLLYREFVLLSGVAFLVAMPLAYGGLQRWLQHFTYRTEIGLGLPVVVGLVVLCATLAAAGTHALRAARTDPATLLRQE